ncbi:conserved hypothetical protein [Candidatus Defluviicoccus seviourii]|uniref:Phage major capsid protein n=1 Tax=Candidatus Defluviicoccus seviourii TaxID=2565273 RepID=A0A564WH85_9PROT|nr:conserved hypothetical protein [Candidatus Defluviicoccus seviourii]
MSETFFRYVETEVADVTDNTVTVSFSSEFAFLRTTPKGERYFEVLGHNDKEVDLKRLNSNAPFLIQHSNNPLHQIGVVERAWIEDRRGRAIIRFSSIDLAQQMMRDIKDGIRTGISVGYFVRKVVPDNSTEPPTLRVTKWEPFEISLVSTPVDPTVGTNRSTESDHTPELLNTNTEARSEPRQQDIQEEKIMSDTETEITTPAEVRQDPALEIEQARSLAIAENNTRVADILDLGTRHNRMNIAREFIQNNRSVHEFRAALLDELAKKPAPSTYMAAPILTPKEAKEFSFARAINALVKGNRSLAGYEWEVSDELERVQGRSANGMRVPYEVMFRDTVTTGQSVSGTNVGAEWAHKVYSGKFIDVLLPQLAAGQLGVDVIQGSGSSMIIDAQTSSTTAYWVGENEKVTESAIGTDDIEISPKTIGVKGSISRRMLNTATSDIEARLRNNMANVLVRGIDYAIFNGTNANNQPKGLFTYTDTNAVTFGDGTDGGAPTYAKLLEFGLKLSQANVDLTGCKWLLTPEAYTKFLQTRKLSDSTDSTTLIGASDTLLTGYPFVTSNQVKKTFSVASTTGLHGVAFGDWRNIVVALWSGIDLNVDPYTAGDAGAVVFRIFQDMGMAVTRPAAFSVAKDLIIS